MATGGTDHMVRIYFLGGETPIKVSEIDGHTVSSVRSKFLCNEHHFMLVFNVPSRTKLSWCSSAITVTGKYGFYILCCHAIDLLTVLLSAASDL